MMQPPDTVRATQFIPEQAGNYDVSIGGSAVGWEYLLSVAGDSTTPKPFEVSEASIDDGQFLNAQPDFVIVRFSQPMRIDSLDGDEFALNGEPLYAQVIDAQTVAVTMPRLLEQEYTLQLIGDSVNALSGASASGWRIEFAFDATRPRIVSSSLADGSVWKSDALDLSLEFSEPIDATSLNDTTIRLLGDLGPRPADSIQYDASSRTATIRFRDLVDDRYRLQVSGGEFAEAPIIAIWRAMA